MRIAATLTSLVGGLCMATAASAADITIKIGHIASTEDEDHKGSLVFESFERTGTINGVLQFLIEHGIRLPCRIASGSRKGDLEWHRPNRVTLSNLLHHPIYAGAYSYGRRPTDPRRKKPGRPSMRAARFRLCPNSPRVRPRHRPIRGPVQSGSE